MTYKAQKLEKRQTLVMVEKDYPYDIASKEVLLKLKVAGICGSDIEYYKHGYCGSFVQKQSLVLGHEFVGEVVAIGDEVHSLVVGDAVVVDPTMPCSSCSYCIKGNYNFCTNMKMFGSASCFPHIDGGFEEYVVVPVKNCFVFDNTVINWHEACLVEPLMVAISAVSKIEQLAFKSVAVFGGGTIGLLIIAVLKAFGVKLCTLIDPRKTSREFSQQLSVDSTHEPGTFNTLFDVCIEAAGNSQALLQCYTHADINALIIQVGTIIKETCLPVNLVMSKELTIKGVFRYKHVCKEALDLLLSKKVLLSNIITHIVSLKNLDEGFQLLLNPDVNTLKVQVAFDN